VLRGPRIAGILILVYYIYSIVDYYLRLYFRWSVYSIRIMFIYISLFVHLAQLEVGSGPHSGLVF